MSVNNVLWFTDYNKGYDTNEQVYYTTQELRVAKELEELFPQIRDEMKIVWESTDEEERNKYFGAYAPFDDKQEPAGALAKIAFKVWGVYNNKMKNTFPTLFSLVKKYPEITSCTVHRVLPEIVLKHHWGETNSIIRIHLGLKVPKDTIPKSLCGIEIKGETVYWEDGEVFGFLDAHPHHCWNKSKEERYIVLIDVLRPQFLKRKRWICARIIVGITYFSIVTRFLSEERLQKTPGWMLDAITAVLFLPITIGTFISNKLGLKFKFM